MNKKRLKKLNYIYNLDMCSWEYPYKFKVWFDKYGTRWVKVLNPTKNYMRTYTDRELINA